MHKEPLESSGVLNARLPRQRYAARAERARRGVGALMEVPGVHRVRLDEQAPADQASRMHKGPLERV